MFEITTDHEYIYQCLTDLDVWRVSSDDNCPPKELFFIPDRDNLLWVKAGHYGLFLLIKQPDHTHEIHVSLNKSALGAAARIARDAMQWGFENIPDCNTLVAKIPAFNHRAQGLAKRVGFQHIGIDRNSFIKDGICYNKHILIMERSLFYESRVDARRTEKVAAI